MADIQSRGTRHAKKQENLAHNNERKKSINTDSEMIQIIELIEKDIKTSIMFYMFKRVEKGSSMINRVMEGIKKNQIKLTENYNFSEENDNRWDSQPIKLCRRNPQRPSNRKWEFGPSPLYILQVLISTQYIWAHSSIVIMFHKVLISIHLWK